MIGETREGFDAYIEQRRGQLGNAIHDLWLSREAEVWSKDPY